MARHLVLTIIAFNLSFVAIMSKNNRNTNFYIPTESERVFDDKIHSEFSRRLIECHTFLPGVRRSVKGEIRKCLWLLHGRKMRPLPKNTTENGITVYLKRYYYADFIACIFASIYKFQFQFVKKFINMLRPWHYQWKWQRQCHYRQ